MKVLFSPIVNAKDKLNYKFEDEKIIVQYNDETDTFDFSEFKEDGRLRIGNQFDGWEFDTALTFQPLRSVERIDGVFHVKLISFIGFNATETESFPEWIDHTEYQPEEEDEEATDPDGETV